MNLAVFWHQLTLPQVALCLGLFGLTVWSVVAGLRVTKVDTASHNLLRDC